MSCTLAIPGVLIFESRRTFREFCSSASTATAPSAARLKACARPGWLPSQESFPNDCPKEGSPEEEPAEALAARVEELAIECLELGEDATFP